jgi:hypothetical protein
MREIKVEKWKVKVADAKGKMTEENESTAQMVTAILDISAAGGKVAMGMEQFRVYRGIADALDEAAKTGTLKLEEPEYLYICEKLNGCIPAAWALNKGLYAAVTKFLEAPKK